MRPRATLGIFLVREQRAAARALMYRRRPQNQRDKTERRTAKNREKPREKNREIGQQAAYAHTRGAHNAAGKEQAERRLRSHARGRALRAPCSPRAARAQSSATRRRSAAAEPPFERQRHGERGASNSGACGGGADGRGGSQRLGEKTRNAKRSHRCGLCQRSRVFWNVLEAREKSVQTSATVAHTRSEK